MEWLTHDGNVRSMLAYSLQPESVGLAWLGQAGFAVRFGDELTLIDPYLSDSLADKYRGCEWAHVRMMPPPLAIEELPRISQVLCTHRHGDHMDPGTLAVVAERSPECRFLVPRAEQKTAWDKGLPPEQIVTIDVGEAVPLGPRVSVTAIPSAHETIEVNSKGECFFLGYIVEFGAWTMYHSGDCVPYPGLAEHLKKRNIEVALLPVNGRDERRRARGVPGNMTLEEAERLCRDAGIRRLIPHHFGMFEFNTVNVEQLTQQIRSLGTGIHIHIPKIDEWFELRECPQSKS